MQRKLLSKNESENVFFVILQDPVKNIVVPSSSHEPRPREAAPRPREAAAAVSETYRPTEAAETQGDPALRMGAMNASSLSASNNGGRATNLKMAFH